MHFISPRKAFASAAGRPVRPLGLGPRPRSVKKVFEHSFRPTTMNEDDMDCGYRFIFAAGALGTQIYGVEVRCDFVLKCCTLQVDRGSLGFPYRNIYPLFKVICEFPTIFTGEAGDFESCFASEDAQEPEPIGGPQLQSSGQPSPTLSKNDRDVHVNVPD